MIKRSIAEEQIFYDICHNSNKYEDGKPCGHAGCLSHKTHPCEQCRRINALPLETKQVIVVRKDLKMKKEKLAAQVGHAVQESLLKLFRKTQYNIYPRTVYELMVWDNSPLGIWLRTNYTKIVLGCNSETELHKLCSLAKEMTIEYSLIKDIAKTEFKEPTYTCAAFGPDYSYKIDKLTGNLKLL